jgi:hypothetical protein
VPHVLENILKKNNNNNIADCLENVVASTSQPYGPPQPVTGKLYLIIIIISFDT